MDILTGNRLQQLRKDNGLSQDALAEKLGLSRQAISKWERGESSPDTDNLVALASLYGMSIDELLNPNAKPVGANAPESSGVMDSVSSTVDKIKAKKKPSLYGKLGKKLFVFPIPIIIVIIFVLIGMTTDMWHPTWLLFMLLPIYYHFAGACFTTSTKGFMMALPIPEIIVTIYLVVGFFMGIWGVSAILFLIIPLYYWIVAMFVKKPKKVDSSK